MKTAIIGSKNLIISDLWKYLPPETTEIVLGGAEEVDACAREFARENGIKLTQFPPEYEKYGHSAPFERNAQMVAYSDFVLVFSNRKSQGIKHVVSICKEKGVPVEIWIQSDDSG